MARARTSIAIYLDEEMEGDVLVTTKDRDKFLVTAENAVSACRAYDKAAHFTAQFGDLLEKVTRWVSDRKQLIKSAHVTIRENDILLLVMQKGEEFDQTLADGLTELDLEIANDEAFALISLDVMSVPAVSRDALSAFLTSGQTFEYNAEQSSSHLGSES